MNRLQRAMVWLQLRWAMRRDDYERAEMLALKTGDPDLRRLVLRNRVMRRLNSD